MDLTKAIACAEADLAEFNIARQPLDENNTVRVLNAMRELKIAEYHLKSSSGYGYNDTGRDLLEAVWAKVFATEDALLRQQIVSGTHAITLGLFACLRPGDLLVSLGAPYDTLDKVIGDKKPVPGSIVDCGHLYRELSADFDHMSAAELAALVPEEARVVAIQRSRGYQWRGSLSVTFIGAIIKAIKKRLPQVIVFVDNCYGEFVESIEPSAVGADLIAGSLIKNAGGGLAPCGGYLAGRGDLIEKAAARLTAPGIGKEVGPSLTDNRLYYQGLFMSPLIVGEALRGAVFASSLWQALGFPVSPLPEEPRADIIQAIRLGSAARVKAFCAGIQKYSPVDSHVRPEGWDMPGYTSQVIMAAGTFIQGSSIELSADAPLREPYNVFLQGGLSHYHSKYAVINTARDMLANGLL